MGFFGASDVAKECDKAAQILKSFIGMSSSPFPAIQIPLDTYMITDKGKIPKEAIAKAKGLAIFTGVRAAMWLAGSGGSGVVVARLPDGSWSPPSAFSVKTGGVGLVLGVDVFDCVCVLNTQNAVNAYAEPQMAISGAVAGPIGKTADMEEVKPVWVYTKSLGLYGGLTVDSTIIKARPDANAEFFGSDVSTAQILKGDVQPQAGASKWPAGGKKLAEVLKMGEGKTADSSVIKEISAEPTPGDLTQ
jgi:lipid-binding SYLF domain-containing protein